MRTEDKLSDKLRDPSVRKKLRAIKRKWGLNQSSYKSIGNFIRDESRCYKLGKKMNPETKTCRRFLAGKYYVIRDGKKVVISYQDEFDFGDEIANIVNELQLPTRMVEVLMNYLIYGDLKKKSPKIGIGIERDVMLNEIGKVVLRIDPDIRLADIKREWHKVRKIQNVLQRDGKKNRSPKNMTVYRKVLDEKISGKKYKAFDIVDDLKKDPYGPRVTANARQMKYRYKKQK